MLSYLSYNRVDQIALMLAGSSPRTVVLDAGHGGEDGGASGKSGVPEKEINLAITKDLGQMLESSGYRVILTRSDDTALSDEGLDTIRERKTSDMHNRMELLESQGSCIFISIHQNFFPQSQYNGAQIFYSDNNGESKPLAQDIRARVVGLLQSGNKREIKPATSSIYLLWHAKVPAVLVECGFLSNAEEESRLENPDYQKQMAFAIYTGFLDYCSGVRQPA